MHYKLPEKQEAAVDTIFSTLTKVARNYKLHHGEVPTIFIDSSDILVKYEKEL